MNNWLALLRDRGRNSPLPPSRWLLSPARTGTAAGPPSARERQTKGLRPNPKGNQVRKSSGSQRHLPHSATHGLELSTVGVRLEEKPGGGGHATRRSTHADWQEKSDLVLGGQVGKPIGTAVVPARPGLRHTCGGGRQRERGFGQSQTLSCSERSFPHGSHSVRGSAGGAPRPVGPEQEDSAS